MEVVGRVGIIKRLRGAKKGDIRRQRLQGGGNNNNKIKPYRRSPAFASPAMLARRRCAICHNNQTRTRFRTTVRADGIPNKPSVLWYHSKDEKGAWWCANCYYRELARRKAKLLRQLLLAERKRKSFS